MEDSLKCGRSQIAVIALLVFSVSLLQTVPCISAGFGLAKGKEWGPPFLEGTRINLREGDITLPANEPCYVSHGLVCWDWNEMSAEERQSSLFDKDIWYELYIDDERIDLREWHHYYRYSPIPLGDPPAIRENVMVRTFYVQFSPGEFEPGTYRFKGVWHFPGGPVWEIDVTFE